MPVHALIEAIATQDDVDWRMAVDELLESRPESIEPLLVALDDNRARVRAGVCLVLSKLCPIEQSTVTRIAGLLEDGSPLVRNSAMKSLVNIGEPSLPVFIERLTSGNKERVALAVDGLLEIGRVSEAVVKTLEGLLESNEPSIRCRAAVACARLGKWDIESLCERLVVAVQDQKFKLAESLLRMIRELDGCVKAFHACVRAFADGDRAVRVEAKMNLKAAAPDFKEHVGRSHTTIKFKAPPNAIKRFKREIPEGFDRFFGSDATYEIRKPNFD